MMTAADCENHFWPHPRHLLQATIIITQALAITSPVIATKEETILSFGTSGVNGRWTISIGETAEIEIVIGRFRDPIDADRFRTKIADPRRPAGRKDQSIPETVQDQILLALQFLTRQFELAMKLLDIIRVSVMLKQLTQKSTQSLCRHRCPSQLGLHCSDQPLERKSTMT